MKEYQQQFIEYLVETGAIRFGEFTLKSGRKSPYFFNSGLFNDGETIRKLGYFYACAIRELTPQPTLLFGPAYKGIPLCVATAMALQEHFGINIGYCFDRKIAKDHGEGGNLVGNLPVSEDRIAIVDDVITDGATKVEAIKKLRETTDAKITSLVIALNRAEKDVEGRNPVAELENFAQIEVSAIANIHDILFHLRNFSLNGELVLDDAMAGSIQDYLDEYGV